MAGLKGRSVAVAKGSRAHYLLVAAVLKAGLAFSDIQAVYLAPSDARAAFGARAARRGRHKGSLRCPCQSAPADLYQADAA